MVCYVDRIGLKGANKRAIIEVLPEPYWQRCYAHFLRRFAKDESFDSTSSRVNIGRRFP
jgi:transposase-like protein